MPKISQPNRPWELPKLAGHLSEREVVSTVLFFMAPNKSSLFRERMSAQLIFQAGSEDWGTGSSLQPRGPGPCKSSYGNPAVAGSETILKNRYIPILRSSTGTDSKPLKGKKETLHQFWWINGLR